MEQIYGFIGSSVCHQMAERSIFLGSLVLPVCARCTGIYFGIALSYLYFLLNKRLSGNLVLSLPQGLLGAFAFLPFMIDGAGSYLGIWQSNNVLRIMTGVSAGISLPYFFVLLCNFEIVEQNIKPIYIGMKEQIMLLIAGIAGAACIYFGGFGFHEFVSLLLCIGIVTFYSSFFAVLFHIGKGLLGKKLLLYSVVAGVMLVCLIGWLRS